LPIAAISSQYGHPDVISKVKILDANADPTKYPDLVVRVTGSSTFFSILPPESRKWIVDRLLQQDAVDRRPTG
jgi:pyruvate-formate lyase